MSYKVGQFIFDIQDIRKAGTTYYKVYEKADKKKTGIQYDETVYLLFLTFYHFPFLYLEYHQLQLIQK